MNVFYECWMFVLLCLTGARNLFLPSVWCFLLVFVSAFKRVCFSLREWKHQQLNALLCVWCVCFMFSNKEHINQQSCVYLSKSLLNIYGCIYFVESNLWQFAQQYSLIFRATLSQWTVYTAGVPGFRWAATGHLPEPPEDGEGERAEIEWLPEGAGESWAGVSETQQSQGWSLGRTRYTHMHTYRSV